jgi:hypothetical protein
MIRLTRIAADAERALQEPRHAAHHRRQHPPVEQQRGQHAHDQHHGQRLKRQDEIRAGRLQVERQCRPAEIAEHERGAGAGSRRNDAEGVRHDRQFDQGHGGQQGDDQPDRRLAQRYRAAVFAKRPGDHEQREDAERRLQLKHDSPKGRVDYGSGLLRSAMPYAANAGTSALTPKQLMASLRTARMRYFQISSWGG